MKNINKKTCLYEIYFPNFLKRNSTFITDKIRLRSKKSETTIYDIIRIVLIDPNVMHAQLLYVTFHTLSFGKEVVMRQMLKTLHLRRYYPYGLTALPVL